VQNALNGVNGVVQIETNPKDNSCVFKAPAGLNVENTLNEIAEAGNKHIQGWELSGK
jgi:hypothetical protein|tara:strand:- start:2842 stop:3012 length:171 start_codon:yes stop_codon:yes gene_type:complete